jgi:peptidyl-prolyl cis-trans isomerase SurA
MPPAEPPPAGGPPASAATLPPELPPAAAGDPSVGAHPDAVPDFTAPPPADGPPPAALPPAQPDAPATTAPGTASAQPQTQPQPIRDPNVQRTGLDSAAANSAAQLQSEVRARHLKTAGKAAATIGDDVITLHELTAAVRERFKSIPPNQRPSKDQINMVAASVLNDMIDRSILFQEAKREIKKPEQMQSILSKADEFWREEDLPGLLKRYAAENEYALKQKLEESGQSLDQIREAYRENFVAQGYMKAKVGPRISVALPEMRRYYYEHQHDFDRPPLVTWREIVLDFDKFASRAQARERADAVLARLRRGEDFARVAASDSQGPNRAKGGLWETSPGGYAVASVNSALESLPIGQISQVIEGPTSYHIVRVEARRAAGPAPFGDVQDNIKRTLFEQKSQHEINAFIEKLRKQTFITTMFDGTASDPARVRSMMGH